MPVVEDLDGLRRSQSGRPLGSGNGSGRPAPSSPGGARIQYTRCSRSFLAASCSASSRSGPGGLDTPPQCMDSPGRRGAAPRREDGGARRRGPVPSARVPGSCGHPGPTPPLGAWLGPRDAPGRARRRPSPRPGCPPSRSPAAAGSCTTGRARCPPRAGRGPRWWGPIAPRHPRAQPRRAHSGATVFTAIRSPARWRTAVIGGLP